MSEETSYYTDIQKYNQETYGASNYVFFNSNVDVDFVRVNKGSSTNTVINTEDFSHPRLKRKTILFNDFGDEYPDTQPFEERFQSIMAKYINLKDQSVQGSFDIYRKTPNQKYYRYVCSITDNYKFYDYNIVGNEYYHYLASLRRVGSDGKPESTVTNYSMIDTVNGEDEYYHTKFDGWSIADVELMENSEDTYEKIGHMWTLGCNVTDQNINQNLNITTWDTIGKYGKVSIGKRNYDTAQFTGLLGQMKEYKQYNFLGINNYKDVFPKDVDVYTERMEVYIGDDFDISASDYNSHDQWQIVNPYATEMEKLKAWKEFCSNGNLKLLRDMKGNAWIVQITNVPEYEIGQFTSATQTLITFNWQEVADASKCSIISFKNLADH